MHRFRDVVSKVFAWRTFIEAKQILEHPKGSISFEFKELLAFISSEAYELVAGNGVPKLTMYRLAVDISEVLAT